ncbi:nitroreductase family protein [Natronococcus sp. A-GB1]|uniref:nitroreductase family protein n=1 Tax=Natronococcus sp. A-GB1 TaxID=3037648 RepID=UPI00241D2664|nr:nitroreductase family protein [Natronococcus sp. A-GB1]MDG5761058.1 nitroreductase family protein [Natronococcus sp. A-GB1]
MTASDSRTANAEDGPIRIDDLDRHSIDHVLTTTRAVRRRLDLERSVSLEVVNECLEIGLQAPTGYNLQNWRWLVITDEETRRKLAEIYRRSLEPFVELMDDELPEDEQTRRVAASSLYLAEHLHEVPVHVIPCTTRSISKERELWDRMEYESDPLNMAASSVYGEVWPAAWSFMLALRSRGLGSSLTMIHLAEEPTVAELLEVPDGVSQAGLIPVAYFKGEGFRRGNRRPLDEVAFYDRWERTDPLG